MFWGLERGDIYLLKTLHLGTKEDLFKRQVVKQSFIRIIHFFIERGNELIFYNTEMSPNEKQMLVCIFFLKIKTHLSNEITSATSKENKAKLLYITGIMAAV